MEDEPLDLRKKPVISTKYQHLSLDKMQETVKDDNELSSSQKPVCRVKKFYNKIKQEYFEQEVIKADFVSRANKQNHILESRCMTPESGYFSIRKESEVQENDHQVMVKSIIPTYNDHSERITFKHASAESEIETVIDGPRMSTDLDRCEVATNLHSSPNISNSAHSSFNLISAVVPGAPKNCNKKLPYICELCKVYETINYSNFEIHLRTHSGVKQFVSDTFNKSLHRCDSLRKHIHSHTGEKPFVCEICNKRFTSNSKLKIHIRCHTGEKPYVCEICNKRLISNSRLKIHIRSHTGEKPFVCETCNKGFSANGYLKIHIRSHTGKPYVCETCNKGFSTRGNLQSHIRSHTGEKPFVCETCNKGFASSSKLKIHIRSHTGEKPFICETCNKGFFTRGNLQSHIRSHTGVKPYVCGSCGKEFSTDSSMKRHERIHKRTISK